MSEFVSLDIRPDLDQSPWTDLDAATATDARLVGVGLLPNGTTAGRAVAVLRVEVPIPGESVPLTLLVQTTWRLFTTAARALAASPVIAEESDE